MTLARARAIRKVVTHTACLSPSFSISLSSENKCFFVPLEIHDVSLLASRTPYVVCGSWLLSRNPLDTASCY